MSSDISKLYPWLNETFIFNKLKNIEQTESIVLNSFKPEFTLGDGENFDSYIIRITVNYNVNDQEKTQRFIMKTCIPTEGWDELLDLFSREIEIYRHILPKVVQLLRSSDETGRISPKCYDCADNNSYLLFEDLNENGYRNVDKTVGLNFQQLKLVLSKFAKWHAATATLGVTPGNLKVRIEPYVREDVIVMEKLYKNIIHAVTKQMEHWPDFELIRGKLLAIENRFYKKICKDFIYNENDFNVIIHGDSWSNNFMYKFDENGQAVDVSLIDFTVACWGTPGKDLSYMLFSSSHKDIGEYEWDKLLQHYHLELSTTLKKLNYPREIPTLNDIQVSFLRGGLNSVLFGLLIIVIRHARDTRGGGTMPLLSDDDSSVEYRLSLFSNPECEDPLKFLLDFAGRKGYFDI